MNDETPAEVLPAQSGSVLPRARREKSTAASVIWGERIAGWVITVGGLLVIFAVVAIMVFLVRVAAPLAKGGEVIEHSAYQLQPPRRLAWMSADEYQTLGVRITAEGLASTFHLDTGRQIWSQNVGFGGVAATAVAGTVQRDQLAFGFGDGTVRFGSVGFDIQVVPAEALPPGLETLNERDRVGDGTVYSALPGNQYRQVNAVTSLSEPEQVADAPIIAIDYRLGGTVERPTRSFVTFDDRGIGRISRAETKVNLLTQTQTTDVRTTTLPPLPQGDRVTTVAMTAQADAVFVAAESGAIYRFDTRAFDNPVLAEVRQVLDEGSSVTAMGLLVGEQALVIGGSNGSVDVYFRLQRPDTGSADGYALVRARSHEPHGAAVTGLSVSERAKTLVTQAVNGEVWVRHSTSDQTLFKFERETGLQDKSSSVMITPRVDGVLTIDDDGTTEFWRFHYPHPETTPRSVFGKVWYEGYSEPTYTWQSSSGTDVFEEKFSLVPLIFGTLKATVYSLIFALPIALLGAIYTSEFVHRRVRASIKPMMEMMEALPTVILGFIAALILAPIVETWIAAFLLAFIALPLSLMLAAYLWQLLPLERALQLDGIAKFAMMLAVVSIGCYLAYLGGPLFEAVFFFGDLKAWTAGYVGTGLPFLALLGFPLAMLVVTFAFRRLFAERWKLYLREQEKVRAGLADAGKWIALLVTAGAVSAASAWVLTRIGYDPRGGIVDTYVQRNALVVGFVMGFAVIPNIYTLAEDSLNSVPSHLRAASLAAGATPWQTAVWVVLPTAMSGVFAAMMIGMGRAVGETMIVVMAAGNTPILEWNIFNGLRTLSANIAVELPEAVKDGTLYRMLFLAALTLFVMTFVINTFAEVIRQRFRKRAFQL